MSADSSTDKHTLSNYEEVSVVHADFAWAVDFEASVLRGSVEYTFGVEDGAEIDTIVLDTNHLNITGVAVMLDEETGGWTERHMVSHAASGTHPACRALLQKSRLRISLWRSQLRVSARRCAFPCPRFGLMRAAFASSMKRPRTPKPCSG